MQKLLSIIGGIAVVGVAVYFCIFTPFKSYQKMGRQVNTLTKELKNSQDETELVYKRFYDALRYHLSPEQVEEIYHDTQFFQYTDSEISVTSGNSNITPTHSFTAYGR